MASQNTTKITKFYDIFGSVVPTEISTSTYSTPHTWIAGVNDEYQTSTNITLEWQGYYSTMLAGNGASLTPIQRLEGNSEAVFENTGLRYLPAATQETDRVDIQRSIDAIAAAMEIDQETLSVDPTQPLTEQTYLDLQNTIRSTPALEELMLQGHGSNDTSAPRYSGFTNDFQSNVDNTTLYVGGGVDSGAPAIAVFMDVNILTHIGFPTVWENGQLWQLDQAGDEQLPLNQAVVALNDSMFATYTSADFSSQGTPVAVGAAAQTAADQTQLGALEAEEAAPAPAGSITTLFGSTISSTITINDGGGVIHSWTADANGLFQTTADLSAEWKADYQVMLAGNGASLTAIQRLEGNAESVFENTNLSQLSMAQQENDREDIQRVFDAIGSAMQTDQQVDGINPNAPLTASSYLTLAQTIQNNPALEELSLQGWGVVDPASSRYSGFTNDFENNVDSNTLFIGGGIQSNNSNAISEFLANDILGYLAFPVIIRNDALIQLNQNGGFQENIADVVVSLNDSMFYRVYTTVDFAKQPSTSASSAANGAVAYTAADVAAIGQYFHGIAYVSESETYYANGNLEIGNYYDADGDLIGSEYHVNNGSSVTINNANGQSGPDQYVFSKSSVISIPTNSRADITGSNNIINSAGYNSYGVDGSNNAIVAGDGDNAWINGGTGNSVASGNGDFSVYAASGGTVTIGGNGAAGADIRVYGSDTSLLMLSNSRMDVFGSNVSVKTAGDASCGLNSANDTIAAGAGDNIWLNPGSSGAVVSGNGVFSIYASNGISGTIGDNKAADDDIWVYGSSADLSLLSNSRIDVFGAHISLASSGGSNVGIDGANDTIAAGAADNVWLNAGSSGGVVTGNKGFSVFASGGVSAAIGSNGNAGDDICLYGSDSSLVLLSDSRMDIFGANISVTSDGDSSCGLNGTNDTITAGAGDGIWLNAGSSGAVVGGNGDFSIYAISGVSATIGGNGKSGDDISVNGSDVNLFLKSNSRMDVFGSDVSVKSYGGSSCGLNGARDTIAAGAGDNIWLNAGSSGAFVGGNGDFSIYVARGVSATIGGNGISGDDIWVNGSDANLALESSSRMDVFGANVSVTSSGGSSCGLNGAYDTIAAGAGDNVWLNVGGTNNSIIASENDNIFCVGQGSKIVVGSQLGSLNIYDFNATNGSVVDLINGIGQYTNAAEVVSAFKSDGHGGALLSMGASGYIDFNGISPNALGVGDFKIG